MHTRHRLQAAVSEAPAAMQQPHWLGAGEWVLLTDTRPGEGPAWHSGPSKQDCFEARGASESKRWWQGVAWRRGEGSASAGRHLDPLYRLHHEHVVAPVILTGTVLEEEHEVVLVLSVRFGEDVDHQCLRRGRGGSFLSSSVLLTCEWKLSMEKC